jgi:hypothetical protein
VCVRVVDVYVILCNSQKKYNLRSWVQVPVEANIPRFNSVVLLMVCDVPVTARHLW